MPASSPARAQNNNPLGDTAGGWIGTWNKGPRPKRCLRITAVVALARATGIKLRGFHSNRSNSAPSIAAATGEAKVADIPPAAPATRRVFRSVLERRKNWAAIEPKAPPVMMIGPSAPKGPPEPIDIAEDTGLRIASFGSTRLPLSKIASIALGIPCHRIRSEP